MESINEKPGLENLTPTEFRMASEDLKKLVLSYSLPTIIGMFVNALYNVVDRFWVGRMTGIGTDALTGLGLCMPIMNIILGCSQLVGIGAAACISINLGKNLREEAEKILGNALSLMIIISVILTTFGVIYAEKILFIVGAEENTLPYALSYIRIILLGSIFGQLSFAMNHPIRATGNPRRFASTQLLGAVTNIILDPILIFVFGMGIEGAAIATIISQFVSMSWVFSYYFSPKSILKIKIPNLKLNRKIAITIFSIGLSPFLMQVASIFTSIIANQSLLYYGKLEIGNGSIAIGALTVINSVMVLFFMPIIGINQGVQPIIGFNYGRGDFERVKAALKWSIIYSVVFCAFGFIIVETLASNLIKMFNDNAQLIEVGTIGIRIALFALPTIGFQITAGNFFQAIGKARKSIFLSLLRQVLLLLPAYFILPKTFGLVGIWLAMPFSDILSSVITGLLLIREIKVFPKKQTSL